MRKTAVLNIKELLQVRSLPAKPLTGSELSKVPALKNAYLLLHNKEVVDFGEMASLKEFELEGYETLDATDRFVFPAFCDSHTHSVFAAPREQELVDKINGLTYQEIAAKGGGILNSAQRIQETSEEELFSMSLHRVKEIIGGGTGALEIKSGYGLTLENELKMLRVIQRIKATVEIPIKATFLAAHALPVAYKNRKEAFIQQVVDYWIPKVAEEGLADYVDLFCETGYFDVSDISAIAKALENTTMHLKVHVNQFNTVGGIDAAVRHNSMSVDHLEVMSEEDFIVLKDSETMATLLPACSFYLGIPYAPAKELHKHGIPLALASDFNPGSSPSHNLFFVWSLACLKMKLTPEEAFNALTINGAFAMGLQKTHGAIFKGYQGKLILTAKAPSLAYFPYAFGATHIHEILN